MTLNKEFLETYFEENVTSALFPLYAERLLEADDINRANEICSEGVEQFPHLATGWLIYARVAMAEEKYADAKAYLFRTLEEDRACLLAAELLLNTEAVDLSEQEQTDIVAVLLDMDSEYETALESLEEISAEEDEGEVVEEPELDEPVEAAPEDIGDIEEESEGSAEEEPLTEADEDDILEDLDFDEEEEPVGEYLDDEETPEPEVDDLPAQEGEENEFLEEVFHEAEEESDFAPPDFEGEMLDEEETAEDFEEEFDLDELQEPEEFEQPAESEEFPLEESLEEETEALPEEDIDEGTEEETEKIEEEAPRPFKEDLKRTNVDFAEIANQDSERAPEAIEGLGLSRDLIESMSQEELLSVLKKKYGLEEEAESSTAFLNRLQEIEDVDDDVKEALQQFDIFKIEDAGKSENELPSAEEEDSEEAEDLETLGEADVSPEEAEDEIEQKIEGDEEIDLDDLDLDLEEDTEDADVDFEEDANEIDEFEDLEDVTNEPQEEKSSEQAEEAVQEADEPVESDEDISVEVPIEEPPEENIADHVKPRPKPSNEAKLTITPRMATFTFADVLRTQGLYEQAYEVLEMMRDKSSNIERIEREQEKLRDLMNSPDDS